MKRLREHKCNSLNEANLSLPLFDLCLVELGKCYSETLRTEIVGEHKLTGTYFQKFCGSVFTNVNVKRFVSIIRQ